MLTWPSPVFCRTSILQLCGASSWYHLSSLSLEDPVIWNLDKKSRGFKLSNFAKVYYNDIMYIIFHFIKKFTFDSPTFNTNITHCLLEPWPAETSLSTFSSFQIEAKMYISLVLPCKFSVFQSTIFLMVLTSIIVLSRASQLALVVKNPPINAGDVRDVGSIPGLAKSLEKDMAT